MKSSYQLILEEDVKAKNSRFEFENKMGLLTGLKISDLRVSASDEDSIVKFSSSGFYKLELYKDYPVLRLFKKVQEQSKYFRGSHG